MKLPAAVDHRSPSRDSPSPRPHGCPHPPAPVPVSFQSSRYDPPYGLLARPCTPGKPLSCVRAWLFVGAGFKPARARKPPESTPRPLFLISLSSGRRGTGTSAPAASSSRTMRSRLRSRSAMASSGESPLAETSRQLRILRAPQPPAVGSPHRGHAKDIRHGQIFLKRHVSSMTGGLRAASPGVRLSRACQNPIPARHRPPKSSFPRNRPRQNPSPSGRGWPKAGAIRPKSNPSPSGRGWPKAGAIRPKSNPSPSGRGWPKAGATRPKLNPSPSGRGWPKAG